MRSNRQLIKLLLENVKGVLQLRPMKANKYNR